jgi:dynein heavy chain
VLAIKIRDCAESETPDRKWVIFDGPVDAVWIENMNTVLDDNKKLCLNSGQIIKLKPTMTIMFEVDDLSHASPATVSRCGMVLLEQHQLGHNVFITSYINYLKTFIDEKLCDKVGKMFHYLADCSVEFTRKNCKFPCPGNGAFVCNHTIKYMDCYIKEFKPPEEDPEDFEQPKDVGDKMV